jgi:hypothetical protein
MPPSNFHTPLDGTVYVPVAASQTGTKLTAVGGVGSAGDYLAGILVVPANTTPGAVSVADGATSFSVFVGGTSTVNPFYIPLGALSVNSAWTVTTGASVSIIAFGQFA